MVHICKEIDHRVRMKNQDCVRRNITCNICIRQVHCARMCIIKKFESRAPREGG